MNEKELRAFFEKDSQLFLKFYWNYVLKMVNMIQAIFCRSSLISYDYIRLYRRSVFCRWQLMTYGEFKEQIEWEIYKQNKRIGGNCETRVMEVN